jgi:hypothetical protein
VISKIDDALGALPINVLQDRFQCPAIPVNIGDDSERGL